MIFQKRIFQIAAVALVYSKIFTCAAWPADETSGVKERVVQYYGHLKDHRFEAAWNMLSTRGSQREDKSAYVNRMDKSSSLIRLLSVDFKRVDFYRRSGTYAEAESALLFSDGERSYPVKHFTLWVSEKNQWLLEGERWIEPTQPISAITPWRLHGDDAKISLPIGRISTAWAGAASEVSIAYSDFVHPYIWVAKEVGFFDRYGLDVKLVRTENESSSIAYLVSQKVQAAYVSLHGFVSPLKREKAELVMLPGLSSVKASVFSFSPKITNLADLKGKKITTILEAEVFPASSWEALKSKIASEVNAGSNEIQFIAQKEPTSFIAGVKSKRIVPDSVLSSPLDAGLFADISYKNLGEIEAPGYGISVTHSLKEKNRDLVRRLLIAHLEGLSYFKQNKERSMWLMARRWPKLGLSKLENLYRLYAGMIPTRLYPSKRDTDVILAWNKIGRPLGPYDIVDISFTYELQKEGLIPEVFEPYEGP